MSGAAPDQRPVSWRWSLFLLGAVWALPAVTVIPFFPLAGLGLALGVIPAAVFNLPTFKRGRRAILLIGALSGVSLMIGSLLTQVPVIAVSAIFVLAIIAAQWARASRAGAMVLALCLPMVGIGLSFPSLPVSALVAGVMIAGSLYAWIVAMLWPEHPSDPPPRPPIPSRGAMLVYGILLGCAGGSAAAIGYALDLSHVGWATGAALLVMRPVRDELILRSIGRAASVVIGALAAAGFALFAPSAPVTGLVVGLVISSLSATQGSRWYIAPAFTSFVVLTLILQASDARPGVTFVQRTVETLIGVGLALFFGALVPAIIRRVQRPDRSPAASTETEGSTS